jgi:pimeloyl-ACP methyl ester carboxylesterase
MPKANILGLNIAYELIGDGPKTAAITVGGRFSKETQGVRALAELLAPEGYKVLIWDRPNCGESDLSFLGDSEWTMNADVFAALLRHLDMAPAFLIGASAGTRISLHTVQRHPDVARKATAMWLSGGPIVLAELVKTYCGDVAIAARTGGMEKVAEDHWWKANIAGNPANRERLLSTNVETFIKTMERWAYALSAKGDSTPVVSISPDELRAMKLPVLVFNSSPLDVHHPRYITERLADMLPNSKLVEPPWGPTEWFERTAERDGHLFKSLPMLLPQLLEFDRV